MSKDRLCLVGDVQQRGVFKEINFIAYVNVWAHAVCLCVCVCVCLCVCVCVCVFVCLCVY